MPMHPNAIQSMPPIKVSPFPEEIWLGHDATNVGRSTPGTADPVRLCVFTSQAQAIAWAVHEPKHRFIKGPIRVPSDGVVPVHKVEEVPATFRLVEIE